MRLKISSRFTICVLALPAYIISCLLFETFNKSCVNRTLLPVKDWALPVLQVSPAVMFIKKVVTVSALGVIKTRKTGNLTLKLYTRS